VSTSLLLPSTFITGKRLFAPTYEELPRPSQARPFHAEVNPFLRPTTEAWLQPLPGFALAHARPFAPA
jgi:hypothetical protein